MKLEELRPQAAIRGVVPDALVTVVSVHWFGSDVLELTYKTNTGKIAGEPVYRQICGQGAGESRCAATKGANGQELEWCGGSCPGHTLLREVDAR
jgi:hypothetical protein